MNLKESQGGDVVGVKRRKGRRIYKIILIIILMTVFWKWNGI